MTKIYLDALLERRTSRTYIPTSVNVDIGGDVDDINRALLAQFEHKRVETVKVYKYKEPNKLDYAETISVLETAKLDEIATVLAPYVTIRNAFDLPSSATALPNTCLCAQMYVSPDIEPPSKKRKIDVEADLSKSDEYTLRQAANAEATRKNGLTPSQISTPSKLILHQERAPVYNGRPPDRAGPPVGLFNPVFNEFEENMKEDKHIDISLEMRLNAQDFTRLSANVYSNERDRFDATRATLNKLTGENFTAVKAEKVESDGSIIFACPVWEAHMVIYELNNEFGIGSLDPLVQASVAYQHYNSTPDRSKLRNKSYCPAILVAIAGPWMCIGGAVYKEAPITEPLTNYVNVSAANCNGEQVERLFFCLNKAVKSLREFYNQLSESVGDAVRGFPFICEYDNRKFSYVERLISDGDKEVYKVKEGNEFRVVKFAKQYCPEAHRLLADEVDGESFAPALRHVSSSKYGGRFMIVMDYVDGKMAIDETLSESQYSTLERALKRLHDKGYVFGDLRRPNILLPQDGISLVDCDWCGRYGEATYPIDLNTITLQWAAGIGPGLVMRKEHDLSMLERLRHHRGQ